MGNRVRHGRRCSVIEDRAAFIRAETVLTPVAFCPEISLQLAQETIPLWQRTEEELSEVGLPPPFWAFAWAGGQALSRYLLDNPGIARDRDVLDFASGSGLVAIAALKAGARSALCADIDPFAAEAAKLNATANGVCLSATLLDQIDSVPEADLILAGDIAYERDLSGRVFSWLLRLRDAGKTVLIGDPGRTYLPREQLVSLASYDIPVTRELEDAELKRASVWAFR